MDRTVDILAFSPHPDDAELGCAGSLILAIRKGLRTAIADMSEGELSSRGGSKKREREKKKASILMGILDRFSLRFPDSQIGTNPSHRLSMIQLIRETKPRMILAPYWKDRHPDHAAAGKLVKEASFYAGVNTIGEGPPHRPERLFYYMIHWPFKPSFVIDISNVWEEKRGILKGYRSQFKSDGKGLETVLSRPEFLRIIEARSLWFGAMIGATYGEPFLTPGPVPLLQLPGLDFTPVTKGHLPPYSLFL